MASLDGGKAEFTFGGTQYLCLSNWDWSGSVQDVVEACSGSSGATTQRRGGTPDDKFRFDVIIPTGNTAIVIALKRGATGAFEAHPEGDTTGNLEFTATNSEVLTSNLKTSPNGSGILSIEIGIDGDLTVAAAA